MRPGNDFNNLGFLALVCAVLVVVCWCCGSSPGATKPVPWRECGFVVDRLHKDTYYRVRAKHERCATARKIGTIWGSGGGKDTKDDYGLDAAKIRGYVCSQGESGDDPVWCRRGKHRVIRMDFWTVDD